MFVSRIFTYAKVTRFVLEKDGSRVSVFRTVGRSEVNFSRDFTLQIQQPTRDQEFSSVNLNFFFILTTKNPIRLIFFLWQELVETLLSTQLRHSTRVDRPGCPFFVPSNGVELTSLYVEALSGENFGDENIFVNRVFELCEVLWGQLKRNFVKLFCVISIFFKLLLKFSRFRESVYVRYGEKSKIDRMVIRSFSRNC